MTFHTVTIRSIVHSDLKAVKDSAIGDTATRLQLKIRIIRNYGMGASGFPSERRKTG